MLRRKASTEVRSIDDRVALDFDCAVNHNEPWTTRSHKKHWAPCDPRKNRPPGLSLDTEPVKLMGLECQWLECSAEDGSIVCTCICAEEGFNILGLLETKMLASIQFASLWWEAHHDRWLSLQVLDFYSFMVKRRRTLRQSRISIGLWHQLPDIHCLQTRCSSAASHCLLGIHWNFSPWMKTEGHHQYDMV